LTLLTVDEIASFAVTNKNVFKRPGGGLVSIASGAYSVMQAHAQTDAKLPEAGGILLGRLIMNCDDVIVDDALPPFPEDRASRFRFFRARGPANKAIKANWERSSGTCNYLGEWHTHPEPQPTPSCLDTRNWKRILKRSMLEQDFLLFIIVGQEDVHVWELQVDQRSPQVLMPHT